MSIYHETHEPPHCPTCDCATHRTADLLWIGAFRYHMGRQTYAVGEFCDALIASWPAIRERVKNLIQREIERELLLDSEQRHQGRKGRLGADCDRAEWQRVWNHIQRSNTV